MSHDTIKVGELARRTGVSVRTLHHYDEIGLLSPTARSAAGHRIYSAADLARLLQIRALQQMGFSLEEVRSCLDDRSYSPLQVLTMQIRRLRQRISEAEQLCTHLEDLQARLQRQEKVSVEEFLSAIEEMTMFEKYYSPGQLKQLQERRVQLGEDLIREVEAEWPRLIAEVRAEMDRGTDPKDPKVLALARRWHELVAMFTGGDEALRESARRLYAREPHVMERYELDPEIFAYVGQALS